MPNYCDFEICVHGEPETLNHFAGCFMDSIKQVPGNDSNEVYISLVDGKFGDFDHDNGVSHLWMTRGEEIQWTDSGDIRIVGWCKWDPPIRWLEHVSILIPGISFSVRDTVENELYESWHVGDGQVCLTHEEFIPLT
jgi:hypothetical protein